MRRRLVWLGLAALLMLALGACNSAVDQGAGAAKLKPQTVVGGGVVTLSKTATAYSTWKLEKKAFDAPTGGTAVTSLTLAQGASSTVYYQVVATRTFGVKGTVTITNSTSASHTITQLADVATVNGSDVPITPLTCTETTSSGTTSVDPTTSITLAPSGKVDCTYDHTFTTTIPVVGTVQTNKASAVLDEGTASSQTLSDAVPFQYDAAPTIYDSGISGCPSGFTCEAPVAGTQSTVGAVTTRWFDVLISNDTETCGQNFTFDNTATLGSPALATASASIDVSTGQCSTGVCGGTVGYWKNHTDSWPHTSPDAAFYYSGMSWIDILNTPVRGSAYLQLAQQFIAAELNVWSGVSGAPTSLISDAVTYFENPANTPDSYTQKQWAKNAAGVLATFNQNAECSTSP